MPSLANIVDITDKVLYQTRHNNLFILAVDIGLIINGLIGLVLLIFKLLYTS